MTLKAIAVAAALVSVSATPGQAFLLLLGAGQKHQEPENLAKPRGAPLTAEQLAAEAAKRPLPPPVFMLPMDERMVLAQAGQPGEPTRELPYWRIELHPPNKGARLTDPTAVVFAAPGQISGLFRTENPREAGRQLNIHTYRMTGAFRVTEQGSHTFAVRFVCTWRCNITMSVGGQEVVRIADYASSFGLPERIERFATTLPVGEYPVEVVFGFPRPELAESTSTGLSGAPNLNVMVRRPSDETLVPISVVNRVPVSRGVIPVPIN
jgi:hypothetical protein